MWYCVVCFQSGKDLCLHHHLNNQGFFKGVDIEGMTATKILLLLFTNLECSKAEGQNSGRK